MAPATAAKAEQPGQVDLSALKTKQHGAWSSGDYAVVGTTLQIVGEDLCEAEGINHGLVKASDCNEDVPTFLDEVT